MKNKVEIIISIILVFVAIGMNAQIKIGTNKNGSVSVMTNNHRNVSSKRIGIDIRPTDTRTGTFNVGIGNGIFQIRQIIKLKPKKDTVRPKNNIFYEGNSEY